MYNILIRTVADHYITITPMYWYREHKIDGNNDNEAMVGV
jgi:hypothetical protein